MFRTGSGKFLGMFRTGTGSFGKSSLDRVKSLERKKDRYQNCEKYFAKTIANLMVTMSETFYITSDLICLCRIAKSK